MASQEYYRGSLISNYNYNTPPQSRSPALNDYPSYFAPTSSSTTSLPNRTPAPAYQSTEHIPLQHSRHNQQPYNPRIPQSRPYLENGLPPPPENETYTNYDGKPSSKLQVSQTAIQPDEGMDGSEPRKHRSRSRRLSEEEDKRNGFFTGRIPWVVFITTLIQIGVFIAEIVKNSMITGSPIMIHPQFNPMIGPSTYVLINMGARFVPCMRTVPGVQDSNPPLYWPCPNTTTSDPNSPTNQCNLSNLCGFNGLNYTQPNQWFRFIIPMFLHAGIIHIGFNMLLQLTMGREMELAIGSVRFALVYFSSGIFGFVLGGNFAATAIASTGASGCLFGILALTLLDLIYRWREHRSPVKDLMFLLGDIIISFVLGLLPGLDNFSHIGGFLCGLVAGICILHSPNILRQRIGDTTPYQTINKRTSVNDLLSSHSPSDRPKLSRKQTGTAAGAETADLSAFTTQPVGFFKNRKPLWWAWWLLRAGALIGVIVVFVILIRNFYLYRDTCSWCKYLSCLPINNWCNIGNLQLSNTTTTSGNHRVRVRRELEGLFDVGRALLAR